MWKYGTLHKKSLHHFRFTVDLLSVKPFNYSEAGSPTGFVPQDRLLQEYGLAGDDSIEELRGIVRLAAMACGANKGSVNVLGTCNQIMLSSFGMEPAITEVKESMCLVSLEQVSGTYWVEDASKESMFANLAVVDGRHGRIRFYAQAPLINDRGDILGTLCVFDDETRRLDENQVASLTLLSRQAMLLLEHRRRTLKAQRQEQRYRAIFERGPAGQLEMTLDGTILTVNRAMGELAGIHPAELIGRSWWDLFFSATEDSYVASSSKETVASSSKESVASIQEVTDVEETKAVEDARAPWPPQNQHQHTEGPKWFLRAADGSTIVVRLSVGTIDARAGQLASIMVTVIDVTAIYDSERRYQEAAQRAAGIINTAADAFISMDCSGDIVSWNPKAEEIFGYEREYALGRCLAELIVPERYREAHRRGLANYRKNQISSVLGNTVELSALTSRGEIPIELTIWSIEETGGVSFNAFVRDISERKETQKEVARLYSELETSKGFLDSILEAVDIGIVACDENGDLKLFNKMTRAWHGAAPDSINSLADMYSQFKVFHSDGITPLSEDELPLRQVLRRGSIADQEVVIVSKDQRRTLVVVNGRAVLDSSGRNMGGVIALQDVTASRARELALAESEERFRAAFEVGIVGMYVADDEHQLVEVNSALCAMTGKSSLELVGQSEAVLFVSPNIPNTYEREPDLKDPLGNTGLKYPDLRGRKDLDANTVPKADNKPFEADSPFGGSGPGLNSAVRVSRDDENVIWALCFSAEIAGPSGAKYTLGEIQDVTAQIMAQEELSKLAHHDALTGLPNRLLLQDRLEHAFEGYLRDPDLCNVLLFLDLNEFKKINDMYGHAIGDQVLREVATRLRSTARGTDTVARLGGDEFVILLERCKASFNAAALIDRIKAAVSKPLVIDDLTLEVTLSVGLAFSKVDQTPSDLIKAADADMYANKHADKTADKKADGQERPKVAEGLEGQISQAKLAQVDKLSETHGSQHVFEAQS